MGGSVYNATWGRMFAAIYERSLAATEEAGLADRRRALLARASGSTLEIGAGTGLNLEHYPDAVTELVLAEPGEHMARRLRAHVGRAGPPVEVVEAPAERLPFPDDRFDTIVSTLVLCTVPEPGAALAEARRVLRPGGRLLFLEHVRAEEPGLARWQDRLWRPWRVFADGCHCNRDTLSTLQGSGLTVDDVERGSLEKALPLIRPMIAGSARAADAGSA
jgi:ubiquinone/menaquinone biosynthesis C-methylase UbiE